MSDKPYKWTKTSSFLVPACGLDVAILFEHGFINAYLNDKKYNEETQLDDIFLLFNPDLNCDEFEILCKVLRKKDTYIDEYDPEEGKVMIHMKLEDKWIHIKEQLMKSKYSLIDREYVKEFFNPKIVIGEDIYGNTLTKDSINYQILTKSNVLKEIWEERLNTTFKDEYEVCSKLNLSEEIYNYNYSPENSPTYEDSWA